MKLKILISFCFFVLLFSSFKKNSDFNFLNKWNIITKNKLIKLTGEIEDTIYLKNIIQRYDTNFLTQSFRSVAMRQIISLDSSFFSDMDSSKYILLEIHDDIDLCTKYYLHAIKNSDSIVKASRVSFICSENNIDLVEYDQVFFEKTRNELDSLINSYVGSDNYGTYSIVTLIEKGNIKVYPFINHSLRYASTFE